MGVREEMVITIDPEKGTMEAEVIKGPGGKLCEDNIKKVLRGLKASKTQKKPEYFQMRNVTGKVNSQR